MTLRDLLPRSLRDALVPRLRGDGTETPTLPPWQAPHSAHPMALQSHRFEHAGRHHRLHVRGHADGTGLVVVDASRLARLDAAGLRRLRAWLDSGAKDAAAEEQALWGEAVLTGSGPPRAANAWESGPHAARAVPEVPIVATLEVAEGQESVAAARVRRLHELAVPHVILRPQSESSSASTLAAVRAAEDLGLVTGVAAPPDLVDDGLMLDAIAALGLDHLALTMTGDPGHLRSLAERAAGLDIPLTGELALTAENWTSVADALREARALGMLGITAWALVGDAPQAIPKEAIRQVAATLERAADGQPLRVTWAAPMRVDDVASAIARGPRTDGDFGMRVRSDGAILPPRGSGQPAGSIDTSSWSEILGSPSWQAFLVQARSATRCDACPGLALCAVDCPADAEGWA